jgi:hypothetical protein
MAAPGLSSSSSSSRRAAAAALAPLLLAVAAMTPGAGAVQGERGARPKGSGSCGLSR